MTPGGSSSSRVALEWGFVTPKTTEAARGLAIDGNVTY